MVVFPRSDVTEQQIDQRAVEISRRAAREELEAERVRDERERAGQEAALVRGRLAAEGEAVRQLNGLRDLYAARNDAARDLAEVIARFWRAEAAIRARSDAIESRVSARWIGMPDDVRRGRWVEMRRAAGLLPEHAQTGFSPASDEAGAVARAVIGGLLGRYIGPGWVDVGGRSATF